MAWPNPFAPPVAPPDNLWANIVLSDSDDESDDEEAPDYWRCSDELRILFELADGRRKTGRPPPVSEVFQALQEKAQLKRRNATADDVAKKMIHLKRRFIDDVQYGGPRAGHRNQWIYDLSAEVWGHQDL